MKQKLDKEQIGLLFGLPALILALLAGWLVWRMNANLDPIEAPQLTGETVWRLTREHIKVTFIAAFFVLITAVPMGVLLTRGRLRKAAGPIVAFANAGQATPVIGLVVLLAMWLGFSFWAAVIALAIYAFLPVLRNTIVGLQAVDRTLVEAARGMGMSNFATLMRIEVPLAAPIIMSGIRTALVLLAGTASFAVFVNGGGLGVLIDTGIRLFRYPLLVSGAVLIAILALFVDWVGRVVEMLLTPKGL